MSGANRIFVLLLPRLRGLSDDNGSEILSRPLVKLELCLHLDEAAVSRGFRWGEDATRTDQ